MAHFPDMPMKLMVPVLPSAAELRPFLEAIDAARIYSNGGPLNVEFCSALSTFIGGRLCNESPLNVVSVSSGTSALEIALRLKGKSGRRWVLLPSFTFIATAHAVANAGFEPWFMDVDAETWAATPNLAEAALAELPDAPAAVIAVSPFGAPVDTEAWDAFEARTGIPVILDMAAAVMSIRRVGRAPMCLSLHATKMISTGEGGAILSGDDAFAGAVARAISFGFEKGGRVSLGRGGNYRISEYASAIGLAAIAATARKEAALKTVAGLYRQHLSSLPLRLQPGFGEDWVSMTLNVELPPERVDATLAVLDDAGVPWRHWWSLGCHLHPAFADASKASLANTARIARCIVGLPFHELLTEGEVKSVAALLARGLEADASPERRELVSSVQGGKRSRSL
jgi:dTDP-4-amino-4,6-dideoxygalactose transaminase